MDLREAFALDDRETVALVGGGGKTTTMYRLCLETLRLGGVAVATGSARFTRPPGIEAPLFMEPDEDALLLKLRDHIASANEAWVIACTGEASQERLLPLSYEAIGRLSSDPVIDLVAVEADGSAMRAFKAPADHEPAMPPSATTVIAVVGADIFGRRLDEDAVHRPERVIALTGADYGSPVTPEVVATVLAHEQGGRKSVPEDAFYAVFINKVTAEHSNDVWRAAQMLLNLGVRRVVLGQAREEDPALQVLHA